MPKMKSHSGTKKRFRRTGTGKIIVPVPHQFPPDSK